MASVSLKHQLLELFFYWGVDIFCVYISDFLVLDMCVYFCFFFWNCKSFFFRRKCAIIMHIFASREIVKKTVEGVDSWNSCYTHFCWKVGIWGCENLIEHFVFVSLCFVLCVCECKLLPTPCKWKFQPQECLCSEAIWDTQLWGWLLEFCRRRFYFVVSLHAKYFINNDITITNRSLFTFTKLDCSLTPVQTLLHSPKNTNRASGEYLRHNALTAVRHKALTSLHKNVFAEVQRCAEKCRVRVPWRGRKRKLPGHQIWADPALGCFTCH